ncbi:4-hydroxybenzoyl-CoA thioesterase [Rhodopirellula maiorica SM1]|uniref:4-hydroxybenzoyl-CoA thioesterase n=1 Tax=Rhodopirellula maiorica SM1 TaxID=1265738 RepID=M5RSQ8_9BACT|nr:thioesterase family protein [Rhodopirellula maiorica]EMI22246.1 4-hydroxybenzoyl-CoA thioesterase [Rhodopirellula maiorica SM1]
MKQHTIELRVRYDECDPMGFVHHSNYLRYFEIGRTELLRASGGCYAEMEEAGVLVVVVRVDCRYRRPAKYDDLITVHTTIARVTAAKIIHEYSITRVNPSGEPEPIVDATVTLAVIDREGKLQRVPQTLLEQYEKGSEE